MSKIIDQEFIESLKANPAYSHLSIDSELNKMRAWILANPSRRPRNQRRFIVNWLNKATINFKPLHDAGFESFWRVYPNKTMRGKAEEVWKQLKPNEELLWQILKKVELFKKTQKWKEDGGKWIPYPSTWLTNKCWLDEVPVHVYNEVTKSLSVNPAYRDTYTEIKVTKEIVEERTPPPPDVLAFIKQFTRGVKSL